MKYRNLSFSFGSLDNILYMKEESLSMLGIMHILLICLSFLSKRNQSSMLKLRRRCCKFWWFWSTVWG